MPTSKPDNIFPRPVIIPAPLTVNEVANPSLSLNGAWKFTLQPPVDFWEDAIDPSSWPEIHVPGEIQMQGFDLAPNVEYAYKRRVTIPSDFHGKKIILRFDGVYSYARVWVNGAYIRDHHGGFTTWDCDITRQVVPGQPAWITVGVTDKEDEISWGSRYAKHLIGGMLRSVKLMALPPNHLTRLHVETDFDATDTHAILKVTAAMAFTGSNGATVQLKLKDPQAQAVTLVPTVISLTPEAPEAQLEIPITDPQKWDAEHPNLYTLEARVILNGSTIETLSKTFGFRKVVKSGNRLYVNGREIKLRGGNRHDVHPLSGRSIPPDLDEQDVLLFREANLNFIRTSHYPPSETFLECCDRYGLYVEEETAVCFISTQGKDDPASQDDPTYTSRYLSQWAEMIERDRDHPCVILWSLGNENVWGTNFAKEAAYVRLEDATRPIIFSYPERGAPAEGYDLWSKHYPEWNAPLGGRPVPTLHDEFAHVNCYNVNTLKRDPGVRNFWGESIHTFWDRMFTTEGCLGGAIWGLIDEVFELPTGAVGYGAWGIVDGWRRKKPEHWLTQKAYSPIRIVDAPLANPGSGNPLQLVVQNRFDHTNLAEVTFEWSVGKDSGHITHLQVEPHTQGMLILPARSWQLGETLTITCSRMGRLIDLYKLSVGAPVKTFPAISESTPNITEEASQIIVSGPRFSIAFSKSTGQITRGAYDGITLLIDGPHLNFGAACLPEWRLSGLSASQVRPEAVINLSGSYGSVGADFVIKINGDGLLTTQYTVTHPPAGYTEMGIAYVLPETVDRLAWERKGLWSVYPADHIGRNSGVAYKTRREGTEAYRSKPTWPWSEDMKDYFHYGLEDCAGRGTHDFRSLKEYLWYASLILADSPCRLRAESAGAVAARAEIIHSPDDRQPAMVKFLVNNLWSYHEDDSGTEWGNYLPAFSIPEGYTNVVKVRLTDHDQYTLTYQEV